ncbi:hypothetical protein EK599_17135 [Vibrio sp. T187]|uniref:DUF2780 domain-containing protein n=1 Tax=Vibrio TaxID=662 RepID=UPI0010C94F83|nr:MULTISPECIES: DUF2780 domain-containing protein [Vibrio]MBW3697420.1 hypothetical protein [Vibrio sp. T187]
MKKAIVVALSSLAVISCASTSDSSDNTSSTNYSQLSQSALSTALSMWNQQSQSSELTDTVAKQASVTTEQAAGGIGSLLALAQGSLSSAENNELSGLIPGMSTLQQTGLTSLLSDNSTVASAFSSLGMDPSLISTFAPIILQVLQSQGASSSLLSSLGNIWQ